MRRIDNIISELCEEIDFLKEDREHWEIQYKELKVRYDNLVMTSIRQSQAVGLGMVAIATGDKELAKTVSEMKVD
jgi:hypothetical protein